MSNGNGEPVGGEVKSLLAELVRRLLLYGDTLQELGDRSRSGQLADLVQGVHLGQKYRRYIKTKLDLMLALQHNRRRIEQHQRQQLQQLLCEWAPRSAYYRQLFADLGIDPRTRSWRRLLERIPPLTRAVISRHLDDMVVQPEGDETLEYFVYATSGTTGEPLRVFCDVPSYLFHHLVVRLILSWWGGLELLPLVTSQLMLSVFDNLPAVYATINPSLDYAWLFALRLVDESSLAQAIALKPDIIASDPQTLATVCRMLQQRPDLGRCWRRPHLIISSGLELPPARQQQLTRVLGAEVVDLYALTELGPVAAECPQRCGLHIDESSLYLEVIDRNGTPLPDERLGELVITSLRSWHFPLIRYRTGDLGVVTSQPCRCGVRYRRLVRIAGKVRSFFVHRDGRLIDPRVIGGAMERLGISEFQVRQEQVDAVRVLTGTKLGNEQRSQLRAAVASLFGHEVRVRFVHSHDLATPGRKLSFYISDIACSPSEGWETS